MATPPSFDYDYLRMLFREHPTWSHRQIADAVTQHEREVRHDPGYPHVTVHAIASVKYRYRDRWQSEGSAVPESKMSGTKRTQPFVNLPPSYWQHYYIYNLRILTRLASGETGISDKKAKEAERFAARLDMDKQVVDLDFRGEPYLRKARPDELDQEGNLIAYAAKFPGLSSSQWLALGTPEARAAASEQWTNPHLRSGASRAM
jgi:hypothetical protein